MLFNPKYKTLGLVTLPYTFFFEFLAPVIEFTGLFMLIYLLFSHGINWDSFWILFAAIYLFSFLLSSFVIFYDYTAGGSYKNAWSYLKLLIASILEPIFYHPLLVVFSLIGYYNHLTKRAAVWGEMTRTGTTKKTS